MKTLVCIGILLLIIGIWPGSLNAQDESEQDLSKEAVVLIIGNVEGFDLSSFILNPSAKKKIGLSDKKKGKIVQEVEQTPGVVQALWDGDSLQVRKCTDFSWEMIIDSVTYTLRGNYKLRKVFGLIPLPRKFGNDRKLFVVDLLADLANDLGVSKSVLVEDLIRELDLFGLRQSTQGSYGMNYVGNISCVSLASEYYEGLTYTATATY